MRLKFIITLIFIFGAHQATSQEQNVGLTLSLEDTLRLAKENSEDLKIKISELEKRREQRREAIGTALPQIAAEASWQKYFKEPVFFGNTVPIAYQLQSGVSVNQTLWAFGRVSGALNAAKSGLKIGELEKELTEYEVEYMASLAYYAVLLSQTQLKIAQQTLENAKQNVSILQSKFSGGRPPQGDIVRLRSDVAVRLPQVKAAESEYQQAVLTLALMVGQENATTLNLTTPFKSDFPLLNEQQMIAQMQDSQPRLELLKQSINFSSEVARVQKSADLPTLSAFGNYTYSGASAQTLRQSDLFDSVFAGVAITWNLWDGGQSRAKYRQAMSDKMIAELGLVQGRENLTLNLKKSFEQYRSLRESQVSAKEAVSLAEQAFNIAQKRFRTGQASVTELNQTESNLTQARLGLALNTYQLHATMAQIGNLTASHRDGK